MFTYSNYSTGKKEVITVSDKEIEGFIAKIESFLKSEKDYVDDGAIYKHVLGNDFSDYAVILSVLQIMKSQKKIEVIPLGWNDFAWKLIH